MKSFIFIGKEDNNWMHIKALDIDEAIKKLQEEYDSILEDTLYCLELPILIEDTIIEHEALGDNDE
jgi:hypothetical protein